MVFLDSLRLNSPFYVVLIYLKMICWPFTFHKFEWQVMKREFVEGTGDGLFQRTGWLNTCLIFPRCLCMQRNVLVLVSCILIITYEYNWFWYKLLELVAEEWLKNSSYADFSVSRSNCQWFGLYISLFFLSHILFKSYAFKSLYFLSHYPF